MRYDKHIFRKNFINARKNLRYGERKNFSEIICKKLEKIFSEQKSPRNIALFAGMNDEVNILRLLTSKEISQRHKFFFPKVTDKKNGLMEFYHIKKISELEVGSFGILEPNKYCEKISPEAINIMCVPAVGIDSKGNRIGMGGGFYDRYLAKCSKNIKTLGVIFSCQYSKELFIPEKFDIPTQRIISEIILDNND